MAQQLNNLNYPPGNAGEGHNMNNRKMQTILFAAIAIIVLLVLMSHLKAGETETPSTCSPNWCSSIITNAATLTTEPAHGILKKQVVGQSHQ